MTESVLDRITAATFRGSPAFELTLLDRLAPEQRAALGDAAYDSDLYGVLVPREARAGLRAKAIDRDTALLYLTLGQPGRLPEYVRTSLGSQLQATISRMVLDGVLEMEHEGGFVSGPAALGLLGEEDDEEADGEGGRLARLSREALRYAAGLEIGDMATLAGRIYSYNRVARSPAWSRRLPSRDAVAQYLDLQAGGETGELIARRWSRQNGTDVWLAWARERGHDSASQTTHKLYVSPRPEALPDALRAAVEVLGETHASGFKVGADALGVLRPDKLVAYFTDFDALGAAAGQLRERLDGLPAHGVPFTAEISQDGLLSWGVDPPRGEQTLGLSGGESWRVWLAHRLAAALLAAKVATGDAAEPWRYALERIRMEGVDPRTWTPSQAMWRDQGAAV